MGTSSSGSSPAFRSRHSDDSPRARWPGWTRCRSSADRRITPLPHRQRMLDGRERWRASRSRSAQITPGWMARSTVLADGGFRQGHLLISKSIRGPQGAEGRHLLDGRFRRPPRRAMRRLVGSRRRQRGRSGSRRGNGIGDRARQWTLGCHRRRVPRQARGGDRVAEEVFCDPGFFYRVAQRVLGSMLDGDDRRRHDQGLDRRCRRDSPVLRSRDHHTGRPSRSSRRFSGSSDRSASVDPERMMANRNKRSRALAMAIAIGLMTVACTQNARGPGRDQTRRPVTDDGVTCRRVPREQNLRSGRRGCVSSGTCPARMAASPSGATSPS